MRQTDRQRESGEQEEEEDKKIGKKERKLTLKYSLYTTYI